MHCITAPDDFALESWEKSVFLAGGITGCPEWQKEMIEMLSDMDYVLFNPRRDDFPMDDPYQIAGQITWEFSAMRVAKAILFWFPEETLCPIVLYELGAWSMTDKPIFVGVHPAYERRSDVFVQTSLARSDVKVVYSLRALADQVKAHKFKKGKKLKLAKNAGLIRNHS